MAIKVVQCVLIVSQVHYYSIIWIFKQKIEALPSFSFTQTFGWTAAVLGLGQDISERFREEVLYKALYKSTLLFLPCQDQGLIRLSGVAAKTTITQRVYYFSHTNTE